MTRKEVAQLIPGTQVYKITEAHISAWCVVGLHPLYPNYLIIIAHHNVSKAECIWLESRHHTSEEWTLDYEAAKEAMWQQYLKRGNSINQVYFNGRKSEEKT